MSPFISELVGTALILLMGVSVVANVSLSRTYGNNSGLIVIAFGWSIAVFIGVFVAAAGSGAHLNPAVTIAFWSLGKISTETAGNYILAQLLGAMAGATLAWLAYRDHYNATQDGNAKLGTFCTSPAISNPIFNLITEAIGTFVLVFAVLNMTEPEHKLGTLNALPVALVVLGIGLCLGGPTGYAINPARDLGPRIMHALLPITDKRDSNWGYAWIPVLGPILGGLLAAEVHSLLN